MLKVIAGLRSLTAEQKVKKGDFVIKQLTANSQFPDIAPMLASLQTVNDELDAAITTAKTGDHEAVGLKDLAAAKFNDEVTKLCDYVNSVAAGNYAALLSSGFQLRKVPQPIGKVPAPGNLRAQFTNYKGVVKLRWSNVYGAVLYNMEMNAGDPNEAAGWTSLGTTTSSMHEVEGLITGKYYYFRVQAVATAGASPMSDLAGSIAA